MTRRQRTRTTDDKSDLERGRRGRRLAAALCVGVLAATAAVAPAGAAMQPVGVIGTSGAAEGQMQLPFGVAAAPDGEIYLTDQSNGRVESFGADGAFGAQWGAEGEQRFNSPTGIAHAPDGDVWVADADGNRIACYRDGALDRSIASPTDRPTSFDHPLGLAVDAHGDVYVASSEWNRIVKLAPDGTVLAKWGTWGQGDGQFMYPQGIAIGADGTVYVADLLNKRVQRFTPDGAYLGQWAVSDPQDGAPVGPTGVAVDPADGTILVVDQDAGAVQRYTPDGQRKETFGRGELHRPWGIAVDATGTVTVADSYGDRLVRFRESA
jgi:DNA-binding beta-propeller fold protein YncE